MANTDYTPPKSIVQTLQTPGAVVTYRAVVGLACTAILALIGLIGGDIRRAQERLQSTMTQVQISVSTNTGRILDQGDRLTRVESGLQTIDHRVTIIEAHQPDR